MKPASQGIKKPAREIHYGRRVGRRWIFFTAEKKTPDINVLNKHLLTLTSKWQYIYIVKVRV
jgi:hypothetical protein